MAVTGRDSVGVVYAYILAGRAARSRADRLHQLHICLMDNCPLTRAIVVSVYNVHGFSWASSQYDNVWGGKQAESRKREKLNFRRELGKNPGKWEMTADGPCVSPVWFHLSSLGCCTWLTVRHVISIRDEQKWLAAGLESFLLQLQIDQTPFSLASSCREG